MMKRKMIASLGSLESLESRRLFAVDLVALGIQVDAYDPASGELTYTTVVANTGSGDTPKLGTGAILLSKDLVINNADDVRADVIAADQTPRFSQQSIQRTIHIPGTTPAGDYHLAVALDADNVVEELDNSNNYMFTDGTITVPKNFNAAFNGTEQADSIQVKFNVGGSIDVVVNGATTSYPSGRLSALSISGLGGNDIITVSPSITLPVYLSGGDGNDLLQGGGANDVLTGGAGKDTLRGGAGNDRLNGNGGNDQLYGETGPDRLFGYAGNDLLDGGSSADRMDGGLGSDTLFGQGGSDIFTANDGQIDQLYGGTGKDTALADVIDIKSSVLGIG